MARSELEGKIEWRLKLKSILEGKTDERGYVRLTCTSVEEIIAREKTLQLEDL